MDFDLIIYIPFTKIEVSLSIHYMSRSGINIFQSKFWIEEDAISIGYSFRQYFGFQLHALIDR